MTCVVQTPEEPDDETAPELEDDVEPEDELVVEVLTQVIVGSLLLHWKSSQQYKPVSMQVMNPFPQITSLLGGQFTLPSSKQLQHDLES